MRALRLTIAKFLTAVLLVLCTGVQVLEATGHWDRALQDSSDEVVLVAVVLCVGAAIAAASAIRERFSRSAFQSLITFLRFAPVRQPSPALFFGGLL
jgi:hypothetical protein